MCFRRNVYRSIQRNSPVLKNSWLHHHGIVPLWLFYLGAKFYPNYRLGKFSSSARPTATKTSRLNTWAKRNPPIKSYHPQIRWLHDHIVIWFHRVVSLSLSHHTAKFGGHMICRGGDTTLFVFSLHLT